MAWLLPVLAGAALLLPACNSTAAVARRAANGDAAAQFEYGRRLLTGRRAPKDAGRALIWFRMAAEQGCARAESALGVCYERGLGTGKDRARSRTYFSRAAEHGHAEAVYALAMQDLQDGKPDAAARRLEPFCQAHQLRAELLLADCFMREDSPWYNPERGVRYLRFLALDGSAEADYLMALCYAQGKGVPQSDLLAEGWLARAAEKGHPQWKTGD